MLALLAAAALDGSGRLASADPSSPSTPPPTDEASADVVEEPPAIDIRRPPNTLYGADDAIQLEDLSPAEQEGVLDTQEGDGARYPCPARQLMST